MGEGTLPITPRDKSGRAGGSGGGGGRKLRTERRPAASRLARVGQPGLEKTEEGGGSTGDCEAGRRRPARGDKDTVRRPRPPSDPGPQAAGAEAEGRTHRETGAGAVCVRGRLSRPQEGPAALRGAPAPGKWPKAPSSVVCSNSFSSP